MVFVEMEIEEILRILKNEQWFSKGYYEIVKYSNRTEVWDWSEKSNVYIEFQGTVYGWYDVWFIPDEEHRVWFKLRWQ